MALSTNNPTAQTQIPAGTLWTNPANALGAADAVVATVALKLATSRTLLVSGFGFNIPATATILGVNVGTWCAQTGTNLTMTWGLFTNTLLLGAAKSQNFNLGFLLDIRNQGGSTDLWSATLTPTVVNASNFGVGLSAQELGNVSTTVSVDAFDVTIYYSAGNRKLKITRRLRTRAMKSHLSLYRRKTLIRRKRGGR